MAVIDFPASPVDSQTFTSGDKTWVYSTTVSAWRLQAQTVTGPTGPTGATGPTGLTYQTFTVPSTLNVGVGKSRFYAPTNLTIGNVYASVGTAPTGSSVIVDVLKNGSTIFTTSANRPTIAVSAFSDSSSTPDAGQASMVSGDYLTISIAQVGSTIAGTDLTVQITLQAA